MDPTRWDPLVGPRDTRRLHHLSGLSSSPSSDDEDDMNSDATFTGSEVALAKDSTLPLPSRRLMETTTGLLVPPHKLSMNKSGSVKGTTHNTLGGNNNLSSAGNVVDGHLKENEQDFTSCLSRTPSGSIFIPNDIPKLPSSTKKSDTSASHKVSIHEDGKSTDRCHIPYPSGTSVPVIPVRNNLRRPMSSRFSHSRFHFRKTLSSKCSWKCTAIVFMIVSLVLLTSLAYFIAVAVLNWQYANKQPCPVMIEDMGSSSDGSQIKSMYLLCKCNVESVHSRVIRDVDSVKNSFADKDDVTPPCNRDTPDEFKDDSSGDHPIFTSPSAENSGLQNEGEHSLDLGEDLLLFPEEKNSKTKRHHLELNNNSKRRVDNNQAVNNTSKGNVEVHEIEVNGSNEIPSISELRPEALVMHDPNVLALDNSLDALLANGTDDGFLSFDYKESVIDPPILLPELSVDSVEVSGGVGRYPEYEPVEKHRFEETVPSPDFYDAVTKSGSSSDAYPAGDAENSSARIHLVDRSDTSLSPANNSTQPTWIPERETGITFAPVTGVETDVRDGLPVMTESRVADDETDATTASSATDGTQRVAPETDTPWDVLITASSATDGTQRVAPETDTPWDATTPASLATDGTQRVAPETDAPWDVSITVAQTTDFETDSRDLPPTTTPYEDTPEGGMPSSSGCCSCSDVAAGTAVPSIGAPTSDDQLGPSSLPSKTMPPVMESFMEIHLGKMYSNKVEPFGHWNVHFQQQIPSLVKFNYSLHEGASVGVYGRRNGVPTHTRYDFVEILDTRKEKIKRSTKDNYFMEFVQFLDQGSWYISVYNDGEQPEEVAFVPSLTDQSSLPCPYDCHGHGSCVMGSCICETDYAGESCSSRVCPVLCSGRGHYASGECFCNPGWKGKECQLREDECEVSDCNGHGDCIDGLCRCFPGYKGFHCEEVDCLDPECSEHGMCANGMCICRKGWKGADCGEPDSDSLRCLPDCSEHGHFDVEQQRCICDDHWSGPDCSQELCDLDCGDNGHCQGNICICQTGWSGLKCSEKQCDSRCTDHGQCVNGTCLCSQGWNGLFCTLEGCPQACQSHGSCVKAVDEWQCKCNDDWTGPSCGIPLEKVCDDKIDNDKDGLVDCADTECCKNKACESSPLCYASPSPLDILLRKQPPAVTASFFQRMQFLIEEGSVQSYAHKSVINESRASVIRGCVVNHLGSGLKGVRVGVASDHRFGFTVTRDTGWFDLMVNGGGAVTLQFQRDPFKNLESTVVVPWNEIVVVDKIVMNIKDDHLPDYKSHLCLDHDYDNMKPVVLATWKHGFQGGCSEKSAILAESQVIQESLSIPGTNLHLVYHSSRMGGYFSTIQLRLTPEEVPPALRFIHLRISIEGILFDKIFEAAPDIKFTYAWDRRNVYRQKVYGAATATVYVGYEYSTCPHTIWEVQTTQVSGHDMSISEIGGWNLDIHHRYNFHEGILQKGDGTNIYLKNKPKVLVTTMGDGHQRPMHCHQCNGLAKNQRLLAPVALAAGPDGSLYVGDFNLVRRIMPDGHVTTVVELSAAQVAYRYHLTVGPTDGKLYISDPEKHQVFRATEYSNISDVKNNIEAVVGNGGKCLPGDKMLCGDGRKARDAKLAYPKGLAISAYGEMYIADGTNIRMVDRNDIIHTVIGDHYHKSHWKPFPCGRTVPLTQVNLRWPTELAINPLDDTLHILDDHTVLRLTPDKRLKVIAGRPLQCPIQTPTTEKSDQATENYLESPQSISFSPSGDLYIAESDSQMVNRVRVIVSDGRITSFAGAESKCSCLDVNCKCFDEDHFLAATSKLSTISSIAVTADGFLHVCDQGNLRVRSVTSSMPTSNELGEFYVYSSETQEIYIFNRHGQHTSTKNILTGATTYTFSYNVNTSLGKLSTVTDEAGNKIYILRDYNNQVNTIENTQGGKCHVEVSRMHMLQGFTTPDNFKTSFEYQGSTGLLRSKLDSSRKTYIYSYDVYGRLVQAVMPTGDTMKLNYNLSLKGASVIVKKNDQAILSLLIKGLDISFQKGSVQERITQYQDGSLILSLPDSTVVEMETVPSPVIVGQNQVLGEIFPVPAKLKASLGDEVTQKFEWKYYLRREGKGKNRQITQVGRKMKVNGEILVAVEFDREQYSEIVYDKNQIPLITVNYDELGRPTQWQPSQNITAVHLKYDKFGRLERWSRGSLAEHYSFDNNGRLADIRYSDNSGIMYKYDDVPSMLPTEIILPSGSRYLLQYDSVGSLQNVIMPNGQKHEIAMQISFGFYKQLYLFPGIKSPFVIHLNDLGQILAKHLPRNMGRTLYRYNQGGQLSCLLVGDERTDFLYYDHRSLLKNVIKTSLGLEHRSEFRYQGSLLKEERHRFNSRSGMDGAKFKYVYDGRLSSIGIEINGKGSNEIKFKYNTETGILEQTQHFIIHRPKINNIFIQDEMRQYSKTIALDAYGRIVVLAVTLWNKEIFSLNLLYDNRSRVKQSHTKIGRDAPTVISNYTYTLDGFLEEVTGSSAWKFTYDINGNMNSVWEGQRQTTSLRYDAGDRLLGYGEVNLYAADSRGFIVQRGEEKFRFNADGQLVHALQLHQYETFYYYDFQGRLIGRKDHKGNLTQFFYADPLHPSRLTQLHYPKDGLTFIYIYDSNGHLMYIQQGGLKYYVASDHLGTPVAIFNAEGVIIKEISRSPFGKIIMDSNPDFYLPIDFQGGIRDSLTQLIHFRSRAYDPIGTQWLTPNLESIPRLLKAPYYAHLYRFHSNDPVNVFHDEESHLTDLETWLSIVGYNTKDMIVTYKTAEKEDASQWPDLPVISGMRCAVDVISSEFHRLSIVPKTEVKKNNNFPQPINTRVATIQSVLGDGILLSRHLGKAIVNSAGDSPAIIRDVVNMVFNETIMLNLHFSVHGQDAFYFVQEDPSKAQRNWDQLQRLGTMFNVTMHNADPADGAGGQVDIKIQSPSMVLNIRYGTTETEEYHRLLHVAKRRATDDAWQHEKELAKMGQKGKYEWSKSEKEELLSTGQISKYHGVYIHDVEEFPELADDPFNIVFKKDSARKRRNRPRKPK